MAEEANIPREKFVLGAGPYSNWLSLETRVSAEAFEIVPAPIPLAALWAVGLLIMVLASSIAYFLKDAYSIILLFGIVLFGLIQS